MTTTTANSSTISPVTVENGWNVQTFAGEGYAAHWERYGGCTWSIEVRAFGSCAETLSINASERGSKSEKRTMIDLNREQAIALRDFLCAAYPLPAKGGV